MLIEKKNRNLAFNADNQVKIADAGGIAVILTGE